MKVMVSFLKCLRDPSKGKVAHRTLSNVVFQIFLIGLLMALLVSCKVYRNIDYITHLFQKVKGARHLSLESLKEFSQEINYI